MRVFSPLTCAVVAHSERLCCPSSNLESASPVLSFASEGLTLSRAQGQQPQACAADGWWTERTPPVETHLIGQILGHWAGRTDKPNPIPIRALGLFLIAFNNARLVKSWLSSFFPLFGADLLRVIFQEIRYHRTLVVHLYPLPIVLLFLRTTVSASLF